MAVTFFYCVVWMMLVAGFSGVLFYHIQAKLVCDEFDGNTATGLDDPSNCFHYVDKGGSVCARVCKHARSLAHALISAVEGSGQPD